MKKICLMLVLFVSQRNFAQDQEMKPVDNDRKGGFRKENLFTGGGLQLSFANSSFVGGISPVFGYSLTNWLDAGVVVNFTYASNNHVTYVDQYNNYY